MATQIGASNMGRQFSQESIAKMSRSRLGNRNGEGNKGRTLSAEHRANITAGLLVRWESNRRPA